MKGLGWFERYNQLWRAETAILRNTDPDALSLPPTMKAQQAWASILVDAIDKSTPLLQSALEDLESANPADPDTITATEL